MMALMPFKAAPDLSRFLLSPMPGLLVDVAVQPGQKVLAGEKLAVIEAMKMENILLATQDGVVAEVSAAKGDSLAVDQVIIVRGLANAVGIEARDFGRARHDHAVQGAGHPAGGDRRASKQRLRALWVDKLGLELTGNFVSERENVDEDICAMGTGANRVEVDLMQPLDPDASPRCSTTPLNHIGLWIDDLPAPSSGSTRTGVRFAPGGIRKGAAGHDITFRAPEEQRRVSDRRRGRADRAGAGAAGGDQRSRRLSRESSRPAGGMTSNPTAGDTMKTYQHFIDGHLCRSDRRALVRQRRSLSWRGLGQDSAGLCRRTSTAPSQAAHRAMREGPWSKMTATERGKLMLRLADLVTQNAERLAEIEVRDNGKLMAEMRGQVHYHPEWWRYFGGLADKIEGRVMPIDKPDMFAFTRHEPIGVVAALTAWNSPLLFVAWKCAPALAAGCAVVIKPSEFTSASTLEFAELTREAGFPDGVFNVVTGFGQEAGSALVDHPDVAKITFTGSDTTGARSMRRPRRRSSASRSNSAASRRTSSSTTATSTRRWPARSRASSRRPARPASPARACWCRTRSTTLHAKRRRTRRVGAQGRSDGCADTQIGPITTPAQYRKVLDYIDIAKAEGARCILGGGPATAPELPAASSSSRRSSSMSTRDAHRAGGGLRAGAVGHPLRRRGRRDRASPTTRSTGSRPASGPATSAAPCACRRR